MLTQTFVGRKGKNEMHLEYNTDFAFPFLVLCKGFFSYIISYKMEMKIILFFFNRR